MYRCFGDYNSTQGLILSLIFRDIVLFEMAQPFACYIRRMLVPYISHVILVNSIIMGLF